MNVSFAQIPRFRQTLRSSQALAIAIMLSALSACATLPPPTSELAEAQAAVTRATAADADQYASNDIVSARDALRRAQLAMSAGDDDLARALALAATAVADLAHARSRSAQADSDYAQQVAEIAALRQRVGSPDAADTRPLPQDPPQVAMDASAGALVLQLDALDAEPQLQGMAAYERLRARQALDALVAARRDDRANVLSLARRRVQIAVIAARTEAVRQRIDALNNEENQLLVQASRQEAERARRETERLRIQARIQAEEAARLRQSAQADSAALEVAEGVIQDVAGTQAAKLKAARAREAELARQEAELLRSLEQGQQAPPAPTTDDDDDTPR